MTRYGAKFRKKCARRGMKVDIKLLGKLDLSHLDLKHGDDPVVSELKVENRELHLRNQSLRAILADYMKAKRIE